MKGRLHMRLSMTRGVHDYVSSPITLTEKDPDVSSTPSPPPPLSHGASEQDEIFIPSSESQGHIYELLTEKMGKLAAYLKMSFVMTSEQIRSTCPDSHVSELRLGLLKWLVKASCTSLMTTGLSFLLCDLSRFHEYISRVMDTTRGPIVTTAFSSASPTMATQLTSVGRAFPTPNNMFQMSDDLDDTILGPLALDFSDDVIDTVLSNGSTDMRSGLMEGRSCTSLTRHIKRAYYSSPATRPKRAYR
jgi:hypothetical protein